MKLVQMLILSSLFIFSSLSAFEIESIDEYLYLDSLAIQAKADKGSFYHDYTRVYSNYFKDIRNKKIRFLEIGIYKGNSVKLWEAYFPNAELHFIDITPQYIEYYSPRSVYHFIDQEDRPGLQKIARSVGEFDVIIDDGGHQMLQQISSLIALFPYVKSGGMYIIEDLHTSYWKEYGGGGTVSQPNSGGLTTIHFLKGLIDSVNAVGAKSQKANFFITPPFIQKDLTFWEKEVRSMHFYDSMCIIFKR